MIHVKFVSDQDRPATWEVQIAATGMRIGEVVRDSDRSFVAVVRLEEGEQSYGGWPTRYEAAAFMAGVVGADRDQRLEVVDAS